MGIFGGNFDPIHVGHLHLAEAAADEANLHRVLFLPMAAPAHRETHADISHRFKMAELAIAGNARFGLDDTGVTQPAPAYTADTLALLRERYPDDALYFIAGIDALTRSRWRRLDEVAERLEQFLVAARPGVELKELDPVLTGLPEVLRTRFVRFDADLMDVSSTAIRALVARRRSIRYLVPDAAIEYIEENGLYR